jgi:S1-C subfamily serine protease
VKIGGSLFSAVIVIASTFTTPANAGVKDFVAHLRPVFAPKTQALFQSIALYSSRAGQADLRDRFEGMAKGTAYGSGWVVVTEDGQNFIVTNRHVVLQAETVDISFEDADAQKREFKSCPIVYIDTEMDLAVCQFPNAERIFPAGFRLDTAPQEDLAPVVAAGYPAYEGKPLWQLSAGTITNSHARIDPASPYLIQHSAPVDPGNSGGPLLVQDDSEASGYRVIGMNMAKALHRESTAFAIPAGNVAEVVEKARLSVRDRGDAGALRASLIDQCNAFAEEVGTDRPLEHLVNTFISCSIAETRGFKAFQTVRGATLWPEKFDSFFINDPVESMRASVYLLLASESTREGHAAFQRVVPGRDSSRAADAPVQTEFLFGSAKKTITWSLEGGRWKISDVLLQFSPDATGAPIPAAVPAAPRQPRRGGIPPNTLLLGGGGVGGIGEGWQLQGDQYGDLSFTGIMIGEHIRFTVWVGRPSAIRCCGTLRWADLPTRFQMSCSSPCRSAPSLRPIPRRRPRWPSVPRFSSVCHRCWVFPLSR